ncbi:snare associated Golgi protein-domain-containing protein [Chytridium lagenaria]|nr:snare associated Golgi protein-domain-containing protein [Chytridium lagenaria]
MIPEVGHQPAPSSDLTISPPLNIIQFDDDDYPISPSVDAEIPLPLPAPTTLREKVVEFLQWIFSPKWAALWAIAAVTGVLGVLLWAFKDKIIPPLMAFCASVRGMGAGGAMIMGLIVFATCFPPMIGYGTSLVLCGFIFGFPGGFLPAYLGAVAGGVLCFVASRKFLGSHYRSMLLERYPKLKVVEDAIEKGGLKLLILIRLAPYPFGIMNVIFSTTTISLPRYAAATSVAAFKNLIHVYIGSTLQTLADIGGGGGGKDPKDGDNGPKPATILEISFMVGGLIAAVGGFVYLSVLLKRAIREAGIEGHDEEDVLLEGAAGMGEAGIVEDNEADEVIGVDDGAIDERVTVEMRERN